MKEWMQNDVQGGLQIEGFDAKPLVDALYEVNQKSIRLTLPSDEAKGYVIDEDGKYARYFVGNGVSWDKFYDENPKVRGRIWVSLPVYDREKGILLVYVSTEEARGRAYAGIVIAYQYREGVLKGIYRESLWEV